MYKIGKDHHVSEKNIFNNSSFHLWGYCLVSIPVPLFFFMWAISFSSPGSSIQPTADFPATLHSSVELHHSGSAWLSIPTDDPANTIQQHAGSITNGR